MSDIDYWNKYPSRCYLKDLLKNAKTEDEKLAVLLRDTLVQQHLYENWLAISGEIYKDPVAYVKKHMPKVLQYN